MNRYAEQGTGQLSGNVHASSSPSGRQAALWRAMAALRAGQGRETERAATHGSLWFGYSSGTITVSGPYLRLYSAAQDLPPLALALGTLILRTVT